MFPARYAVVTMDDSAATVSGLVLAAGAGSRYGHPKALALDAEGRPWVSLVCEALRAGGVDEVVVALGAEADRAAALVPDAVCALVVPEWSDGLGATLARALESVPTTSVAVVVAPVDVPTMPPAVVRRVLAVAAAQATPSGALVQACFDGRPGHPVVIGRDHWPPLRETLHGDVGARPYLVAHGAVEVECSDLWHGADVDTRP